MTPKRTHRLAKSPSISVRLLADYMAASDTRRRSIIRSCKFQPIAKVVQHDQAKSAISHYFVTEGQIDALATRAANLRNQMTDDEFDRHVLDFNADYLDRFVKVQSGLTLPDAEILAPGPTVATVVAGVRVTIELAFRMRRVMRNNKVRLGGAMLRYAKGTPLDEEVGRWQSAFLFGLLDREAENDNEAPEHQLCITIDSQSGQCYSAPGDSSRRFKNMQAALTTIVEQWSNIPPPPNATL